MNIVRDRLVSFLHLATLHLFCIWQPCFFQNKGPRVQSLPLPILLSAFIEGTSTIFALEI